MWMLLVVAPMQAVIGDFARPEHAQTSAGEARRDRRPLGEPCGRRRAADPVRLARHGSREDALEAIEIPRLGSLHPDAQLGRPDPGLKDFPPEDRPNSTIVFWTFRVMVGLGVLMILLGAARPVLLRRGGTPVSHRAPSCASALLMGPAGLVAILAGWFTTEIGRQPWIVYGLHAHRRCGLAGQCMRSSASPGAVHRRLLSSCSASAPPTCCG